MTNLRFEKEEKNPRKNKKKIEIWKKKIPRRSATNVNIKINPQDEYDQLLVLLGRQPEVNLQPDKLSAIGFGS